MRTVKMIEHCVCDFCGKEWDQEIDRDHESQRVRVSFRVVKMHPVLGKELETVVYERTLEGDVICGECFSKVAEILKNGKEIVNGEIRLVNE